MTRDEIQAFVREVIGSGSSFSSEGINAQVEKIVERWEEDRSEACREAVSNDRFWGREPE